MRLLQGGCRQDHARRLRAGGQALGHVGHPRELRVRPVARGFRPFRADPRDGGEPDADAGGCGHPHLLQRPRKLHPRRCLSPRPGAGDGQRLGRRRLQLDRHPVGGRGRDGAGAMDGGWRETLRPGRREHRADAALPGQPALPGRAGERNAGPALCRSLPLSPEGQRARGAAHALPRAPGRARRGLRRDRRLGARQLVRAAGAGTRLPLFLETAELLRQRGRGTGGGARQSGHVRHVLLRQAARRGA